MIQAQQSTEAVAIVGMAGRFPGARSIAEFWNNLLAGEESISTLTDEQHRSAGLDPEALRKSGTYVPRRGLIEKPDWFDAAFFNISPREAEVMDPQHRVFIEECWTALEDAGCDPARFGGPIGVFAGSNYNTYWVNNVLPRPDLITAAGPMTAMTSNDKDYLATRVAFKLNLHGPAVSVQTACSTSLVAVAHAVHSLQARACDFALAGGVSIVFPQECGYQYQEDGIVSPDGRCRAFDSGAQGTAFSSGIGIVALKRMADAVRDGDHIYAVIKSAALNNDGSRKRSYSGPSAEGHAEVIAMAHAMAGITAESISYIEAHGTGTLVGDPIEIEGLTRAFRTTTQAKQFCGIGSVKTNIGHLDAAAGVAGLIKTALALKHRKIPANINLVTPNPTLNLPETPFYVITQLTNWPEGKTPRRAGVSSFGIGGTNAHVVLEEAPTVVLADTGRPEQLLLLSARSESSLTQRAGDLADWIEANPTTPLPDITHTLQEGRHAFSHRRAIVCPERLTAISALRSFEPKRTFSGKAGKPKVAFIFPGQGAQFIGMGAELYELEPTFRDSLDEMCELLHPHIGLNLRTLIHPADEDREKSAALLRETRYTQPAIFAISVAMARFWQSLGVAPDALLGHSFGEFAAAVIAGVFSAEDAARIVATRARLIHECPRGVMLAVRLQEEELLKVLEPGLSIAAVNGPGACVVAGPEETVANLEARLAANGVACKRLETSHAFHSEMIAPVVEPLAAAVTEATRKAPAIRILSTVTADWLTAAQAGDPMYWGRHARATVRFAASAAKLLQQEDLVFIECGPGNVLSQLIRGQSSTRLAVPSLRDGTSDLRCIYYAAAQLWCAGLSLYWKQLRTGETRSIIALPSYPFERRRFWADTLAVSQFHAMQGMVMDPVSCITYRADASGAVSPVEPAALPAPAVPVPPPAPVPVQATAQPADMLGAVLAELNAQSGQALGPDSAREAFFELGFDSLFLTQFATAIQKRFGTRVTFRMLSIEYSTPVDLAAFLGKNAVTRPTTAPAAALAPVPILAAPCVPCGEPRSVRIQRQLLEELCAQSGRELEELDPNETFFDLGLDSLFLTQFATTIQKKLGVRVTFRTLAIEHPTVEGLAKHIDSQTPPDAAPSAPAPAPLPAPKKIEPTPVRAHGPYRKLDTTLSGPLTAPQREHIAALVERYTRLTPKSKKYTAEHRAHLADPRAVAGFRREWKEMVYPLVAEQSKGSRLWDMDGNEYIDVTNSFGPVFFGHRPDFVVEAIERVLAMGIEVGPTHPLAGKVAKQFSRITGMDRVAFCNTGSEAVAAALRISRTITGRDTVAVFASSYHGVFDEVLYRQVNKDGYPAGGPLAPGIPETASGSLVVLDYGTPEALKWIRANVHTLAAVLIEPVRSRYPSDQPGEFLREVRRITQAADVPFILDEIITGLRSAPGGAQEIFGVKADIATYGKVVGGGLPIGVLAGSAKYLDALDGGAWNFGDDSFPESGMTFFAGTFVRHPLALAAASAVLDEIEKQGPQLQKRVNAMGDHIVARMNTHLEKCGLHFRWENFGSLMFLTLPHELRYAGLIHYHMRMRGIYIWEGRPVYLTAAHTPADLGAIALAWEESINTLIHAGLLPGVVPDSEPPAPSKPNESATTTAHQPSVQVAPLTESQTEVLLCAELGPEGNAAFNAVIPFTFSGRMNPDHLQRAVNALSQRHESLRTTFDILQYEQRVHAELPVHVVEKDLRTMADEDKLEDLARIVQHESTTPFDLVNSAPWRVILLHVEPERDELLITAHHIICDGWSGEVLIGELAALCREAASGQPANLPPASVMREYAKAEFARRGDAAYKQIDDWWAKQFDPLPPALELPADIAPTGRRSFRAATHSVDFPPDLTDKIRKFSAARRASVFTTLLSASYVLLSRLAGQSEIVLGVPFAGQMSWKGGPLIGHCINYLPLRRTVQPDGSFLDFLNGTAASLADASEHSDFTLARLLKRFATGIHDRVPLVPVGFTFEKSAKPLDFGNITGDLEPAAKMLHPLLLSYEIEDCGETFRLTTHFNADTWHDATIERWGRHYFTLLEHITSDPAQSVGDLPILSTQDRITIVKEWNRTTRPYAASKGLDELFEDQMRRDPDAIAITSPDVRVTYSELNIAANRIAQRLTAGGVQPRANVGICTERSAEMIAAILAVLKLGCTYVPFDPEWPNERASFIIKDADLKALVTTTAHGRRFTTFSGHTLYLDAPPTAPSEDAPNPTAHTSGDHPAYVMYTSGSTGTPKGVIIPQRAVTRLVQNTNYIQLSSADVVAHGSNPAFDASTFEIWGALLNGGTVAIIPSDTMLAPARIPGIIREFGITTMWVTSSLFNQIVTHSPEAFGGLQTLLIGGEALNVACVSRVLKSPAAPRHLINGYGPTETTTFACWHPITAADCDLPRIPLGRPISNAEVYILDDRMHPVPPGAHGEIYIGGEGLAISYLNRPDLTAERFLPNPFLANRAARIYRTGDRARFLDDGRIDFLGRIDGQIKLRGFRIEAGEIEAEICRHPSVQAAAVKVIEIAGDRQLAGYIVPKSGTNPSTMELRMLLQQRLPDYMIPASFTPLATLPLNRNGKVDRAALPTPNAASTATTSSRPACEDTERRIAKITGEILGRDPVGATDDFFHIGGHSLLAIALIAKLKAEFGVDVPPSELFQTPTVEHLAEVVRVKTGVISAVPTPQIERQPALNFKYLLPIQKNRSDRPPVFIIPGGMGGESDLLAYIIFARELGSDLSIFGLKARGAGTGEPPHATTAEMAADYIREIRQIQPHGPYHIFGECVGGVCAHEVARQLTENGEEIGLLLFLDTWVPMPITLASRVKHHMSAMTGLSLKQKLQYIEDRAADRRKRLDTEESYIPADQPDGQAHYPRILFNHRIQPYSGKFHLMIAEESHREDGLLGWQHIEDANFEYEILPGTHVTYIRDNTAAVARKIRALLTSAWSTNSYDPTANILASGT